ncbi:hypothetical protein [Streptomyces afghaniensis]|uniref:hypothetical protein n=1 Tax=Streptomyces afghaniensis TaxID=66865 RepID=UPI0035900BD3
MLRSQPTISFAASVPCPAAGTLPLIVQAPDSATNTAHDGINNALLGHHIGTSVEQPEPVLSVGAGEHLETVVNVSTETPGDS